MSYRRMLDFQGGFARCYELTDMKTKEIFAGKIVAKSLLLKPHQKEKMSQEICIHRSLKHKHLVAFHSYFEDADNVYIILELCRRRVSVWGSNIVKEVALSSTCAMMWPQFG